MRIGYRVAAAALTLATTACEPDSDQLADAYLFNRPAAKVQACFGQPDRRIPVGIEQIWVYRIGRLRVDGWVAALDRQERPTFSAPSGDCEARFTIDSHGVRGIAYTDTRGAPIPRPKPARSRCASASPSVRHSRPSSPSARRKGSGICAAPNAPRSGGASLSAK